MPSAPLPDNERARLAALAALHVLDTPPDPELDALVRAAAEICGTPISLISLIDADRQWFKANIGLEGVSETPRELAFCAHAILDSAVLEVTDASIDTRFSDNALVLGAPDIRFYAGTPLSLSTGERVGTLCVIDTEPKTLDDTQRKALSALGEVATLLMEGRRRDRTEVRRVTAGLSARALLARLTSHGVLMVDARGLVTWVNEGFCRLSAYAVEEAVGQALSTLLLGAVPGSEHVGVLKKALKNGEGGRFELPCLSRSGDTYWVDLEMQPVLGDDGGLQGFVLLQSDISRRKADELALRRSEALLNRIGVVAGVGGWSLDLASGDLIWTEQTRRLHGVPNDYVPDVDHAIEFYAPEARPVIREALDAAIQDGGSWDLELPMLRSDGTVFWAHVTGTAETVDGKIAGFLGAFQDITERRDERLELARERELLQVTLKSIGDAVITTDAQAKITWMNPVAERLTGWSKEEAHGVLLPTVFPVFHEETGEPAVDPVQACIAEERVVGLSRDTMLRARDGREYGIQDSAAPIRDGDGLIIGAVLVFHDVSEQRRLGHEMRYRAMHDSLTSLFNRSELEARLQQALDQAHRDDSVHALMFIDLDQFKVVNDTCGHGAGDHLLQQVAGLLKSAARSGDIVARLGGDEFVVLLTGCTPEQAQRLAEQVSERFEAFRFQHGTERFRVGASIGIAPVDARFADPDAVLVAADSACRNAKEQGRNRVVLWHDSDVAIRARSEESQWVSRLERALDDERFVLFAQCIEPLTGASDELHAEVLLRLRDENDQLLAPAVFLSAAERFHLMPRIDRWVLGEVVDSMRDLHGSVSVGMVCVNLSGRSVGDRAFHTDALGLLEATDPWICQRLCLEITETAAITHMADAIAFVQRVRELGVRVALDDFGAGASSFGYLKSLPVDVLKIDGQFVRNLLDDPLDAATVSSFVEVARVLGLQTVAEFVENAEIAERLRAMGVTYGQGYLFHRPESWAGLLQRLVLPAPTH